MALPLPISMIVPGVRWICRTIGRLKSLSPEVQATVTVTKLLAGNILKIVLAGTGNLSIFRSLILVEKSAFSSTVFFAIQLFGSMVFTLGTSKVVMPDLNTMLLII